MPSDPDIEEGYASSQDSDFAPEDAQARESSPEASDDEAPPDAASGRVAKRKHRGTAQDEDADAEVGFENSGDEAIIEKAKTKRLKKATKAGIDEDEGGDGGLIKTRSQRAQEKAERKSTVISGPVTVDVDALWAQMNESAPMTQPKERPGPTTEANPKSNDGAVVRAVATDATALDEPEMISIKRTYNFAGKVHTEEKLVARDSAEAKLYLQSLGEGAEPDTNADDADKPKRRPKKAFRSAFEPVSDQFASRADLNLGIAARMEARDLARDASAKKLTTVEKSRMDWAGYVDKEGIKDELALAGKSKHSYAEREGFLARSEARREDDARRARMASRV